MGTNANGDRDRNPEKKREKKWRGRVEREPGNGKSPRAFCYSDEKFPRHADWVIMSHEKCENEPACLRNFNSAEQPRHAVMTSLAFPLLRGTFYLPIHLIREQPSFLIARGQVSSRPASVRAFPSLRRKNMQLSLERRCVKHGTPHGKSIPRILRGFGSYGGRERRDGFSFQRERRTQRVCAKHEFA